MYNCCFANLLHCKAAQSTAEIGKVVDSLHNNYCFHGDALLHASKLKHFLKICQPIKLKHKKNQNKVQ